MRPILKRPSTWSAIGGVVIAIVAFVPGLEPLVSERELGPLHRFGIIVGFLVLWLSTAVSAFLYVKEMSENLAEALSRLARSKTDDRELTRAATSLLLLLVAKPDALGDPWMVKTIQTLAALLQDLQGQRRHIRPFLETVIDRAIAEAKRQSNLPWREPFPEEREPERVSWLRAAIVNSGRHVNAVTLDFGDYFLKFWDLKTTHFKTYLEAHHDAVARDVTIRRLFIMQRDALDGTHVVKRDRLIEILRAHEPFCRGDSSVQVMCLDDVPPHLQSQLRSFLTCDDFFASESFFHTNGEQQPGYVIVGAGDTVATLDARFRELLRLPDRTNELYKRKRR